MKCLKFSPLLRDMKANNIDKEHYSFVYNKLKFDVIIAITKVNYEILLAAHSVNWGCALEMNFDLEVEMPNEVYRSLCDILHLSWQKDKFNSSKFLFLLSEKAPKKSSLQNVDYQELRCYVRYRSVEDSDKIYFCGWNDHIKDRKTARNFDKTEFFFGLQAAEYCRIHNISSLWTDKPHEEVQYISPDCRISR